MQPKALIAAAALLASTAVAIPLPNNGLKTVEPRTIPQLSSSWVQPPRMPRPSRRPSLFKIIAAIMKGMRQSAGISIPRPPAASEPIATDANAPSGPVDTALGDPVPETEVILGDGNEELECDDYDYDYEGEDEDHAEDGEADLECDEDEDVDVNLGA